MKKNMLVEIDIEPSDQLIEIGIWTKPLDTTER